MSATLSIFDHSAWCSRSGKTGRWFAFPAAQHALAQLRRLTLSDLAPLLAVLILLAASGLTAAALYDAATKTVMAVGTDQEFSDVYRVGQNPWAGQLPWGGIGPGVPGPR